MIFWRDLSCTSRHGWRIVPYLAGLMGSDLMQAGHGLDGLTMSVEDRLLLRDEKVNGVSPGVAEVLLYGSLLRRFFLSERKRTVK